MKNDDWQVVFNGMERRLVRGKECHGGFNPEYPEHVSSLHVAFMLHNHPTSGTVLHIGLGAGEISRILAKHPVIQIAVEVSPEVLDLAGNFNLPSNLGIVEADAREFVKTCLPYDHVFVDIGSELTPEFCRNLKRITAKTLTVNLFNDQHSFQRLGRVFPKMKVRRTGPNDIVKINV